MSDSSEAVSMWQRKPTGNFQQDLAAFCKDLQLAFVPQVINRNPKKGQTWMERQPHYDRRSENSGHIRKRAKQNRIHTKPVQGSSPPAEGPKTISNSSARQSSGTTILTTPSSVPGSSSPELALSALSKYFDKTSFFVPCIQVDLEVPDDDRTVKAIYIRGWRLDKDMWLVMRLCWPALERLSALHFYRAGLNKISLTELCSIVALCQRLTTLVLDNNDLDTEAVSGLLNPNSILQHLSLCFCGITDCSVAHLVQAVGSPFSPNSCLVTLRLTGNRIGDQGAGALADALKLNSSLLVLTLTANRIGDPGAQRLAQALSYFPLPDEWSQLRKEMVWATFAEDQEDWRQAKRLEYLRIFQAKGKRDKNRKEDASHDLSLIESSDNLKMNLPALKCTGPNWLNFLQRKVSSRRASNKHDAKPVKKYSSPSKYDSNNKSKFKHKSDDRKCRDSESVKFNLDSTMLETPQAPPKPSWFQPGDQEVRALGAHPLLQAAIVRGQDIWLPGNRSLISLNLSRNAVGEVGVRALLTAMQLQEEDDEGRLLRLELHKNPVIPDCPAMMRLQALMHKRDPMWRIPRIDLEKVGIHPCALPSSVL